MKTRLLLLILVALTQFTVAQPLANDWIDYNPSRTYLKVKIAKNGLYRIPYASLNFALQNIGENLNAIDPRSMQIFGRGEEQFIHIEGQSDGSFDPGDYIEFYAEKNDGWADQVLYPSAQQHTNPHYSLYNDTATYFLTWRTDGSHSTYRFETVPQGLPATTPVSHVIAEQTRIYNAVYRTGKDLGAGKAKTEYHGGKGWMSDNFGYNNSAQVLQLPVAAFQTPSPFAGAGAPQATVEVAVSGVNRGASAVDNAHHVQVQFQGNGASYTAIADLLFESYDYVRSTINVDPALLGTTTNIRLQTRQDISLLSTTSDYNACAYVTLRYPRTTAFNDETALLFYMPQSTVTLYFNATNFTNAPTTHLYDLGLHKRYEVDHNTTNGNVKTNIHAGVNRKCYLASESAITEIAAQDILPVGSQGKFLNPASLEVNDAFLIISHQKLWQQASSYASYRSISHNPVLLDIEVLYDQFAYGIRKHPLAIRNFAQYALQAWQSAPKHLLLLGKSIEENTMRKSAALAAESLVPTIGNPVTDVMLTAGLNGTQPHVPAIPTGRISASSGTQVGVYLTKIQQFEQAQNVQVNPYTLANRQWQKHVLHFAGGDNILENNRFVNYLTSYKNFVEDSLYAGKVFLFRKTSSSVFQELNTDSVRMLLQQGVSLMTFFGHSSGNAFDLSVDDPTLWNNSGRYPVVIANSCYSGNIHQPVSLLPSISEQYVFAPSEGAIAFIATPDLSYETQLHTYTVRLHEQMTRNRYGKSIGEQMRETCATMPSDERHAGVALEMAIHGDPALKLYPHEKTELTINDPVKGAAIELVPQNITSDLDSFDVVVKISNLGRSAGRAFSVSAQRTLPTGEVQLFSKEVTSINYSSEVKFRLPVDAENAVGENGLAVNVDYPLSLVEEEIESSNNVISNFNFFISSTDVFPVFPYNYAVVPDADVTLKANTGFPFLPEAEYLFQIDTTDLYNSPIADSFKVSQGGAVLSWKPEIESLMLPDSTVFFWRVAPTAERDKWREYSFQVIQGKNGWGQKHFFQLKNNDFDLIDYNRSNRKLGFNEASRELQVQVIGNPGPSNYEDNFYTLDGQLAPMGEYGIASTSPGLVVAVIDSITLKPWGCYGINMATGLYENADKQFGNFNNGPAHRSRVEYYFTFNLQADRVQLEALMDMIENHVEDGHYLLIYTQMRGAFDDNSIWTESDFDFFASLGADSMRFAGNQNPYIFFVKKGRPESARQVVGTGSNDIIRLMAKLQSNFNFGEMNAPQIGPAMNWTSLHTANRALEVNATDTARVTATATNGSNESAQAAVLFESGTADIAGVNADAMPYMNLNFYTEDNQALTPAQLRNWYVLYDPSPDAAVNPVKGSTLSSGQSVFAGANAHFGVAIENISDYDFEDFKVHYWISDTEGNLVQEAVMNYDGLKAGALLFDSLSINTTNLSGRYTAHMEVNPRGELWHREQYHFNNRAFVAFEVERDNVNPLLDVTFDGRHILNGDIVSPQPNIVMEVKDENTLLMITDTSSCDVFLTAPGGAERRIPYFSAGKEVMQFEPARDKNNKAKITYQPTEALADGEYKLTVMGRDASGNQSGTDAYMIDFEVINRSTVTHVMNYPNPFTTSTRFVFTLTGAEIPDVFTIQIMTITGKVVREITKHELGPIYIGKNLTEYAWDGRDEFGDRLANGVYLYRVIMKTNGKQIEHRQTEADQYFTESFGKMYLFR